jgi:uncharacterized iron-regulated protein
MHRFYRSLLLFILIIFPCVTAHAAQFARVSDKKTVDLAEVVKGVEGADVIFIGEIHDSPQHHKAQADVVRSLHAKGSGIAIGLEMFTQDDQQQLDDWVAGKLDEERFMQVYLRNWSYGWPLYRDLFILARDNHIPLIALNIPKPVISRLVALGRPALQENEIPPKLSWSLNEPQTAYMRAAARQAFGNTPPERLVARLCDAQALRNNGMAWNIAKYRKRHPTDRVVVLSGTWHAAKSGVPEQLAAYGKLTYQVILPELPELTLGSATVREADYLMMR